MTRFNVYIPGTTMFAHCSCCLHIPLAHPCLYYYLLSPQYTVLHILFHCTFYPLFLSYFYFILTYIYIYIFSCVMFHFNFLHCPLSGPVLIYSSLLIISSIIEYVMNKRTLNLQRQECGTTEIVSEAPGAYGIRSCSHGTRIASYETISALATLPGHEVGMAPRYTSGGYHPAVSPLPQPLDRPCLSTGQGAPRTSVPAYCCHNASSTGWGATCNRQAASGLWTGPSTALAHQLPRAVGSAFSLTAVPATAIGQPRASPHGQHCGCLVHQPAGRYTITPHVTACPPSPPLESHAVQVTARCSLPGEAQSCGRRALMTAHIPRRVATPSRVIWSRFGEAQVDLMPAVFFPDRGPPRHRRTGTQLASGLTQVCVSPSEPTRTDTVQAQGG